jgi:hypothetical protein
MDFRFRNAKTYITSIMFKQSTLETEVILLQSQICSRKHELALPVGLQILKGK